MYKALQGRCGVFCGDCDIYVAYSTNDLEAQRSLAAEISQSRGELVRPEQIKCLGCKGPESSSWKPDCKIRACTQERGMEFCYQCSDFPCDQLQDLFKDHPRARENLRTISKIGPDAWVAEMLSRNREGNGG